MSRTVVYLASALAQALFVIWVVVSLVFVMSRLTSDPITISAPPTATPEDIEALKEDAGLNDPIWQQYVRFIGDVLHLDLGTSFRTQQPAIDEVTQRLPKTIQLGTASLLTALVLGIPLGVVAAVHRNGPLDFAARFIALVGQATPSFWLGLVLIYLFGVRLGYLPTGGSGSWQHLVLPAATLALASLAAIVRLTRAGVLDVVNSDFVRSARAKGLSERAVILRHVLRNALLPVVTVTGLLVGRVFAGAIVVETVFAWPGLGRLMINSVTAADYPVIQACVMVTAALIVVANLIVDASYRYFDPRIR